MIGLNKNLNQKRRSGNVTGSRFLNNDFAQGSPNVTYPNVPLKSKISEKNRQNFDKRQSREQRPPQAAFHSNQS